MEQPVSKTGHEFLREVKASYSGGHAWHSSTELGGEALPRLYRMTASEVEQKVSEPVEFRVTGVAVTR